MLTAVFCASRDAPSPREFSRHSPIPKRSELLRMSGDEALRAVQKTVPGEVKPAAVLLGRLPDDLSSEAAHDPVWGKITGS